MKCWHCGTELIWGGAQDIDEEYERDGFIDEFDMVTNLSCPECRAFVIVYRAKDE